MAIVIPKYELYDVPLAKEIKSETIGPLMKHGVKGWGWEDSGEDDDDDDGWRRRRR